MNAKRILTGAAVAAIAASTGLLASHWLLNGEGADIAHAASPSPTDAVAQLWATAVTSADGKPQSLSQFKGRPVVVNFWASWCGPCVEEMPELTRLHHAYQKKGVQFVGLGVDSAKNVQAFLQKVQVDYPVYVVGFSGTDLARAFGNHAGALPFTIVIDAKGMVRSTKLGLIDPAALRRTLDSL